jgi:hypothetical protein
VIISNQIGKKTNWSI